MKGGKYTPNEDRSRSMNRQDVAGQAAIANHEAQVKSNAEGTSNDDSKE
ncbi:hypothetical protein YTPLAS73_07540 [Nitrosarchaeum sp.]|nr:hypothetical protein YTPLAS73_07540 [Nitrosarchaeum sp.]